MDDLDKNVEIHIDWLAFTLPLDDIISIKAAFDEIKEELANLFFYTSANYGEVRDYAQNGYEYQTTLGENIIIRYGGQRNSMKKIIDLTSGEKSEEKYESLNVELKGQACREIEKISNCKVDYVQIINWVQSHGGHFTRIDIAIDDLKGDLITLDRLLKHVKKGLYTSTFRNAPQLFSSGLDEGSVYKLIKNKKGTSIYFGWTDADKKNNTELCIYDKKAERAFRNDSYEGEYWVRYEMRFRNDTANYLAYYMFLHKLNDIGIFACEQLKRLLTLKCQYYKGKKSKIVNVRMLDNLPEWDDFLNVVKGTKFTMKPVTFNTIDHKKQWCTYSLTRQNILFYLADAFDDDNWIVYGLGRVTKQIRDMINYLKENMDRISQKDLEMVNNYKRSQMTSGKGLFEELTVADLPGKIKELENLLNELEKRYELPF